MERKFPTVSNILKEIRRVLKFSDLETVVPLHKEYSLVGMAIDYRIRFYLKRPEKRQLLPFLIPLDEIGEFKEIDYGEGKAPKNARFINFIYGGRKMKGRVIDNNQEETLEKRGPLVFAVELESSDNILKSSAYLKKSSYVSKNALLLFEEELVYFLYSVVESFLYWLDKNNINTTKWLSYELEIPVLYGSLFLSLLEQKFRSGKTNPVLFSLKKDWGNNEHISDFLEFSFVLKDKFNEEVIKDLYQLSLLFRESVLDDWKKAKITYLNPIFSGSWLVGGADADLILDHTLIDIKTFKEPSKGLHKKHIYQLLGYVLLDFRDDYRLEDAGFYFSRQGYFWQKNLKHFLIEAGARESLEELRRAFLQGLVKINS